MTAKPIGTQIREAREALDWKRQDLAREARVSWTYVKNVEEGLQSPTAEKLGQLGRALGITFTIPEG